MNGHSCAFLLLEVFRLFPESEGVSGDVFEDVLGIGEVTRGAFVGIRKRVHLMPNLECIGNPQSRGIPTWFVLPDDMMFSEKFSGAMQRLDELRKGK